jgi:hypothetical protein
VQFKFSVSENMDSWFIEQPKSGGHVCDIIASSSTEESHGPAAGKRMKGEKISDRFSDIWFFLSIL